MANKRVIIKQTVNGVEQPEINQVMAQSAVKAFIAPYQTVTINSGNSEKKTSIKVEASA
jgi:hypothetical protein